MAACTLRSRLRLDPRCVCASRFVCGYAGIFGDGTPRPRIGAMAARLWHADDTRIQGAEDLDGAKAAWHREVRPADRSEYRARPLSGHTDRGGTFIGAGRADEYQHSLLSLPS